MLVIGLVDSYLVYVYIDDKGCWVLFNEIYWVIGKICGGEFNNGFGGGDVMYIFWVVWCWSGDDKYFKVLDYCVECGGLGVFFNLGENYVEVLGCGVQWNLCFIVDVDGGSIGFFSLMVWQVIGDKRYLEVLYVDGIQVKVQCEYMNIEGYWWFDCVEVFSEFLQCVCLGGIVFKCNQSWLGYIVSWCFVQLDVVEQVVLLVYVLLLDWFKVIVYNLGKWVVEVDMIIWNVIVG